MSDAMFSYLLHQCSHSAGTHTGVVGVLFSPAVEGSLQPIVAQLGGKANHPGLALAQATWYTPALSS